MAQTAEPQDPTTSARPLLNGQGHRPRSSEPDTRDGYGSILQTSETGHGDTEHGELEAYGATSEGGAEHGAMDSQANEQPDRTLGSDNVLRAEQPDTARETGGNAVTTTTGRVSSRGVTGFLWETVQTFTGVRQEPVSSGSSGPEAYYSVGTASMGEEALPLLAEGTPGSGDGGADRPTGPLFTEPMMEQLEAMEAAAPLLYRSRTPQDWTPPPPPRSEASASSGAIQAEVHRQLEALRREHQGQLQYLARENEALRSRLAGRETRGPGDWSGTASKVLDWFGWSNPNNPRVSRSPRRAQVSGQVPGLQQVPQVPGSHQVQQAPGSQQVPQVPGLQQVPQVPGPHQVQQAPGSHQVPQVPGLHQVQQAPGSHQAPQVPGLHQAQQAPGSHQAPQVPNRCRRSQVRSRCLRSQVCNRCRRSQVCSRCLRSQARIRCRRSQVCNRCRRSQVRIMCHRSQVCSRRRCHLSRVCLHPCLRLQDRCHRSHVCRRLQIRYRPPIKAIHHPSGRVT